MATDVTLVYIGKSIANQVRNPLERKLNFCSLEELNQIKISHDEYPLLLDKIKTLDYVQELCLISTCNRFELFLYIDGRLNQTRIDQIKTQIQSLNNADIDYDVLTDSDAQLQIIRSYCGLNSSLIGESEISAQFEISFKQCLHMGYLGSKLMTLYHQAQVLRERINNSIFAEKVSYCDIAIAKSLELLGANKLNKIAVFGSGSTAYQTILTLVSQGIKATQITLVHRISSSSSQIDAFRANQMFTGLSYLRCKDGYHVAKVREFTNDTDLLVFTIDSKHPVMKIGANSQNKVIDFNSKASCEYETGFHNYISSSMLNSFVSSFSSNRNQDEEFIKQIEIAEGLIRESLEIQHTSLL